MAKGKAGRYQPAKKSFGRSTRSLKTTKASKKLSTKMLGGSSASVVGFAAGARTTKTSGTKTTKGRRRK